MGNIWAGQPAVVAPVQPAEDVAAAAPAPEQWWPLNLSAKGTVWRGFHRQTYVATVSPAGAGYTYGYWPSIGPIRLRKIKTACARGELVVCDAYVRICREAAEALFAWSLSEQRCLWIHSTTAVWIQSMYMIGDFVYIISGEPASNRHHLRVLCARTGAARVDREVPQLVGIGPDVFLEARNNTLTAHEPDGTQRWQVSLQLSIACFGRRIKSGPGRRIHGPLLKVRAHNQQHVFVELATGRVVSKPPANRPCTKSIEVTGGKSYILRCLASSCQLSQARSECACGAADAQVEMCEPAEDSVAAWMPSARELARCECAAVDDTVAATDELNSGGAAVGLVRAVLVGFMAEGARIICLQLATMSRDLI